MSYYTVQQTTKREAAKGTCRSCFNPLFRQSFSPRGPVQWKQTAAALKMSLQDIHWITAVVNVHGQTELHWCSYYCTDITHSCSWSGSFCFIFTDNFTNSLNVRHGYNVKNWKDQCYCHDCSVAFLLKNHERWPLLNVVLGTSVMSHRWVTWKILVGQLILGRRTIIRVFLRL